MAPSLFADFEMIFTKCADTKSDELDNGKSSIYQVLLPYFLDAESRFAYKPNPIPHGPMPSARPKGKVVQ
jgi:hypothetical protein